MICLRTGERSRKVLLPTGITLMLKRDSVLCRPEDEAQKFHLDLRRGGVLADVNPRRHGPPFSIATALGRVEVVGTLFSVNADGVTDQVAVLRGRVHVTRRTLPARSVSAGETLFLAYETPEVLCENDRRVLERDAARAAEGAEENLRATIELSQRFFPPEKTGETEPAAHRKLPTAEKREAPEGIVDSQSNNAPSLAELLSGARNARLERQWQRAARLYRRILKLYPDHDEAGAAMVALGDIELNKLHHPQKALRLFDAYLLSGKSSLAQEAVIGKAASLKRLGRASQELRLLKSFNVEFPASIHKQAVRRRIAEIEKRGR